MVVTAVGDSVGIAIGHIDEVSVGSTFCDEVGDTLGTLVGKLVRFTVGVVLIEHVGT